MSVDFSNLRSVLVASKIQQTNPSLYQVINQLIDLSQQSNSELNASVNNVVNGISGPVNTVLHGVGNGAPAIFKSVIEPDFAFTDVTTANVSTSKHGLAPKGSSGTTRFWRQDWTLATPSGSGNVTGPGSAVDKHIATYNGVSGTIIQDCGAFPFASIQTFKGSGATTFTVHNTSYIEVIPFEMNIDRDVFPFTQYRMFISGLSTIGGQSVTAQVCVASAPGTGIHTGGNDIVVTTGNLYDSGWLTRDTSETGKVLYDVSLKGSNGTVDLSATYIEVLLAIK